ncbi:hypothetical protein Enr10x_43040 [Gimesia panareensis]|uniref:Uncharacterized protein n=1 Tax=Gimesia panareensis TaxID=2527978 RepID=A0A517QBH0_9PLAN|nr:hypothetical protein Enr10x_43040 [Gimesia panareensis]
MTVSFIEEPGRTAFKSSHFLKYLYAICYIYKCEH